jgi:hypothetical protein
MDTITLGAFARSGNHYFEHLVQTALIDVKLNWLSHRISDWDNQPNCVTIIRNPLDCVASWISTTQDERLNRAEQVLEWYISYYEKIDSLDKIVVLPFEQLINDSLGSINHVCDVYGLNKSFFSSNDTLKAAFSDSIDYVWANWTNTDLSQIKYEIKNNYLFKDATKIYKKLCVPVG